MHSQSLDHFMLALKARIALTLLTLMANKGIGALNNMRMPHEPAHTSLEAQWELLPQDALWLATRGSTELLATCRLVCKSWRCYVDATVDELELSEWPTSPSFVARFTAVKKLSCMKAACALSPGLHQAKPCSQQCDGRDSGHCVAQVLEQLIGLHSTPQVSHLTLAVPPEEAPIALLPIHRLTGVNHITVAGLPSISHRMAQPASHSSPSTAPAMADRAAELAVQLQALTDTLHGATAVPAQPDAGDALPAASGNGAAAAAGDGAAAAVSDDAAAAADGDAAFVPAVAAESLSVPDVAAVASPSIQVASSNSTGLQSAATAQQTNGIWASAPATPSTNTSKPKMALGALCALPKLQSLQVLNSSPDFASLVGCSQLRYLEVTKKALPIREGGQQLSVERPQTETGASTCHVTAYRRTAISDPGSAVFESVDSHSAARQKPKWVQSKLPKGGLCIRGVGQLTQLTHLSIPNAQPGYFLPSDFTLLTGLRSLDVSKNVVVSLPEGLGNLTALTSLNINYCCLGEVPGTISCLTNLQQLNAAGNPGIVFPLGMTCLTALTHLDLTASGSNIGQILEYAPDSFQGLQHLILRGADVTVVPPSLSALTNLRHLDLSENAALHLTYSCLVGLSKLTSLLLVNCQLMSLPQSLPASLVSLDVSHNRLGKLPESLMALSHLAELNASYNELQSLPESISKLTSLTLLDVSSNLLTQLPSSLLRPQKRLNMITAYNPVAFTGYA